MQLAMVWCRAGGLQHGLAQWSPAGRALAGGACLCKDLLAGHDALALALCQGALLFLGTCRHLGLMPLLEGLQT